MEQVVPWERLEALIEPVYPSSGRVGRQPMGVPRRLRMYFLQQWFGLADEAVEDAIYDSHAMREFVGIDLARESVPDATTLLKFRRLLEEHKLTTALVDGINAHLAECGLLLREGTMVDATLIAAPPSTKNAEHARDPEMHQTPAPLDLDVCRHRRRPRHRWGRNHRHRHELRRARDLLGDHDHRAWCPPGASGIALACELAPAMHDVGVQPVRHRHLRHRCPGHRALLQHQHL